MTSIFTVKQPNFVSAYLLSEIFFICLMVKAKVGLDSLGTELAAARPIVVKLASAVIRH